MAHYFGAHNRDAGGIHMAARRAAKCGMRALQFFSAPPQYYGDKVSVKKERAERFTSAVKDVGLDPRFIMVHGAYVLNTASPEPEKYARAKGGLAKELERSTALGVFGCCFHPGSAGSSEPDGAIARIAEAMVHAIETVPGTTRVLIENTAGAGRTMGRTAEEVAQMLAHIPAQLRSRAGYGLDTCHLFSSGHKIHESAQTFQGIVERFCDATGEAPAFFHLNDSEGALGSNRDRHALLGAGAIGLDPFRWLLENPRSHDVPLILETPQSEEEIGDEDDTPDPFDVQMIRLLEELDGVGRGP
ncbi:MAG: deoxyribonuclease IV [Gemmatimonadaceae bacterium]